MQTVVRANIFITVIRSNPNLCSSVEHEKGSRAKRIIWISVPQARFDQFDPARIYTLHHRGEPAAGSLLQKQNSSIMSLFSTLDLWSVKAGECETFGFHSLVVSKLDKSEYDKIIVGSFDGMLRIYQVNGDLPEHTSFKPSDLLVETQLSDSIFQVVVGKLVSGAKVTHIGVVHPRSICVYNFVESPGSTEHGSQFEIKLIYEHPLQHYLYQVVVGPFGAVKGRDFLCALAVDGTLSFFEQETFVYETQLPSFLLPSPITYVAETDSFVTLTRDWCIVAYKYQDLVTAKKKVNATWSYNLGETMLDIQTRRYGQRETYLIALSEHNVTCFSAHGLLKFASRLQYSPICFQTYVNEYNNSVMMLIVSDSGTVFIYESCTLRWSAKLPIIPSCILRVNLGIDGALALLSSEGDLNCCFLGTRPTLFVAPPLENSITRFKHVNRKLESLQNKIRDFKKNNRSSLSLSVKEQEISIAFKLLPYDQVLNKCQLALELKSSCPLSNIRVSFEVNQPAYVQPASFSIPTLYEQVNYNPIVEIGVHENIIISRTEITAVVCYKGTTVPRIIRKSASIWPKFLLHSYAVNIADDEDSYKFYLNTNKNPTSLLTLFQDLRDDQWVDDEVIGICVRYNPHVKCIISASKISYGFNLSSNSTSMMSLMISQLIQRCKKCDAQISFEYRGKIPTAELLQAVQEFVSARNTINEHETLLEKLCAQYRLIQRRLLVKVKDKIPSCLTSLHVLYSSTHEKLMDTLNSLEECQKNLLVKACNLQAIVDLTFELALMKKDCSKDAVLKLKTAMDASSLTSRFQDWGERTLANLTYLLRTSLSNSSQDEHRLIPPSDHILTDSGELVSVISTAMNRVLGIQLDSETLTSSPNLKNDEPRAVSPILELEENDELHSSGTNIRLTRNEKLLEKRPVDSFVQYED